MDTYARHDVLFDSGLGSTLYDKDGKPYIDFTSGIGVNSLGYGDKAWLAAITGQAEKLQHISNLYYTAPQIILAEKLTEAAGMKKAFFCNSGAEANEGAIKLARKYSFDKYGGNRADIITLKGSFHGRTITTLKATGQEKFHNYFFPFTEGFVYAEADNFEDFISKADNSVCAVILEGVQGEGGVCPLDIGYVQKVASYCVSNDILVIFDEVQTGVGRTGKNFCFEHFSVKPDIISVAKGLGAGLPIGAFLCNEKLEDILQPGQHGTTFGGNPVCTAGAVVVLDRVCNDAFLKSVTEKGRYIKEEVKSFNSPLVKDIRGKGLMIGIEIDGIAPKEIIGACLENGLAILSAGSNVLRFLPPLVISYEEIDKGLGILKKVLGMHA
ncbi:MAG: aspartate aminotransferase family protein [Clostridiales bacterium]|nr:aspartate aminotransferase family protein [Clostridiales bacterium]